MAPALVEDVLVEESSLKNIADAIRNKNGLSTTYTPSEMASAITALEKTGFDIDDVATRKITGQVSGSAGFIGSNAFYACSSLTVADFPNCTSISNYAFYNCASLTAVNFPNCISIGTYAFQTCTLLVDVNFPNCTLISGYAFYNCVSLTNVNFPMCGIIGNYAFSSCISLKVANFPNCTSVGMYVFYGGRSVTAAIFPKCTFISNGAFRNCYNLLSLYLNSVSTVTTLSGTSIFTSTPIGGYTTSTGGVYGSVFVPMSLVTSFKTATNWTAVSDRIVGCNTLTSNTYLALSSLSMFGLTFSADTTTGIVTVNGTATAYVHYVIFDSDEQSITLTNGATYQLFCCPPGESSRAYGDLYTAMGDYFDYGSGVSKVYSANDDEGVYVDMIFRSGHTFSNFKFKPMLIEIPN